ncbi:enoyl-CoA hydratase/isomerase family protein [Desulfoferula mesophila]|uniref:Enoyl-CoA hydratase n=1 Tax=Desulfoferula mesophila TaxID=3058419 RepID=A0AAU9F286_9BACT|nr:hypothetical protein FAK_14930 [Desulfoferula mesophilus]
MNFQTILYAKDNGVAVITLNRADKLNTVNSVMRDELIEAIRDCERDDQVRVLIITGGTEVFCAGADVTDQPGPSTLWDKLSPKRTYSYYHLLEDLGKPVIAAIAGYCLGGGLELACACDIRIAADNAKLGDAHTKLGIMGGGGSSQRLPRLIGIPRAKELIFSGLPIDAEQAERINLVNQAVPVAELMDTARELAELYKQRPPLVLKLFKAAIGEGMEMPFAQGFDFEAKCAALISLTEDYQEAINAFKEKRKPCFQGK